MAARLRRWKTGLIMRTPRRLSAPLLLALTVTVVPASAARAAQEDPVRFAAQALPATVGAESRLLVLDADGDDLPDIFIARDAGGSDVLLHQRAPGEWEARTLNEAAAPTYAALALDLNRDFHGDVLLARATGLVLLLNDGKGGFRDATPPAWQQPLTAPVNLAAGDVDKDGWPDVYVRHATAAVLWRHAGTLVEGAPQFSDNTVPAGLGATAGRQESVFFDADDDGDLDLALAGTTLVVMENDGQGHFARHDTRVAGPWRHLSVGDDNDDGRLDILLSADRPGKPAAVWARNGGNLAFRAERLRGAAGKGVALRAVNLDNDSRVDLLQTGTIRAWQRRHANDYAAVRSLGKSRALLAADLDRDGFTDVLAADADGRLGIWVHRRNAHHWVGVRLRGQENAAAMGARVVVYMPDGSRITRQYLAGEDELRFGLGRRTAVGGVRIYWPSGRYTQIETLGIDQHLGFVEPTAASGGRHVRLKEPLLGVQRHTRTTLSCQ